MALEIIITSAGRAALVNAQHTGTAPVVIARCGVSPTTIAATPATVAIPNETKRIATLAGTAVSPDTIHLIVRDESADSYTVRTVGLYLGDGTLFAVYSQADVIAEKAAASMLLLAIDCRFEDIAATDISFGDTNFLNPPATTEMLGVVELATDAEATTGVDVARAVTPKAMSAAVTSWLNDRLGAGAPSAFMKSLLPSASAVALRMALSLKGAALKDEGHGNGLNADMLDGQHASAFATGAHLHDDRYILKQPAGSYAESQASGMSVAASRTGYVGGWARGYSISGNSDSDVRAIYGAYGSSETPQYAYIAIGSISGATTYAQNNALRVSAVDVRWGNSLIWHAGNDGAGSGLDADLLDGQHGADYIAYRGVVQTGAIGDLAGNGIYYEQFSGFSATLLTLNAFGSTGPVQMRFSYGGDLEWRNKQNSSAWNDWRKIWNSANDGAGSGLDADLLDGRQATEFALLTGASFTGRIYASEIVMSAPGNAIYCNNWGSVSSAMPMRWFNNGAWSWENGSGSVLMSMTTGGALNVGGAITRSGYTVWDATNDGAGSGLDADLLDGQQGSYYTDVVGRLGYTPLNAAGYTASDIRAKLLTVDGSGSGIDADLLDGQDGSYYSNVPARLGYTPLNAASYTAADVRAKLLTVDGSGTGIDADLLDGLHASDLIPSGTLAATGYCLLPNGLILQWGRVTVQSNSYGSITFPIAFPNACFHIHSGVATELGNGDAQANCPLPYQVSKTGADFWNAAPTASAWWMALGN
ncbi:hypothetical protein SAMN06295912_102252 [Sphingomonas laterariae]|uniref:Putative tail fiber protein gp53-like C-terminal domain-containing protein n=1 Tax=Edaphosphingomonas laterariae TaxID=861865 RepID=A0A239CJR5_9SPHN|nr:hypothetical protein [Sphingomonas laterariae]SNS20407.1 hypothetical protein SAMN06295912_102252 [Sphingomonas laterariae]